MYIVKYNVETDAGAVRLVSVEFNRPEQASNFMQAIKSSPMFRETLAEEHYHVDVESIKLVDTCKERFVY